MTAASQDNGFAIVIDIGKTHSKLSLWSRDGRCLDRVSYTNSLPLARPYRPLDASGIAAWLFEQLPRFAGHPIEAIIPVAHGAAAAGVNLNTLSVPPPDYEWEFPADRLTGYREQRADFSETGSPALPGGLNLGAQLHFLDGDEAKALSSSQLMPWPQYWAWLLSGAARSEVSSLGCHTDLWSPATGAYSPMAQRRGWDQLFAPMAHAGEVVGTLRPMFAKMLGLSPDIRIHAGLHDSNAALHAARGFPELRGEATVLSTGTWFVAMRSTGEAVNIAALDEGRDCLVNVDVDGRPVPSARFMGGREIELLGEVIDRPGTDGVADVLWSGAMVLPAQVRGTGPFPEGLGRWINRPDDADERAAAVALYAALMADASLDLIGARDTLLVEGRFARSEIFTRALASMRPDTRVLTAEGEADVSFGALRLLMPELVPAAHLTDVEPLPGDLAGYRALWREDMEALG
jgi:sugar (pentulose or hexulose) kinase